MSWFSSALSSFSSALSGGGRGGGGWGSALSGKSSSTWDKYSRAFTGYGSSALSGKSSSTWDKYSRAFTGYGSAPSGEREPQNYAEARYQAQQKVVESVKGYLGGLPTMARVLAATTIATNSDIGFLDAMRGKIEFKDVESLVKSDYGRDLAKSAMTGLVTSGFSPGALLGPIWESVEESVRREALGIETPRSPGQEQALADRRAGKADPHGGGGDTTPPNIGEAAVQERLQRQTLLGGTPALTPQAPATEPAPTKQPVEGDYSPPRPASGGIVRQGRRGRAGVGGVGYAEDVDYFLGRGKRGMARYVGSTRPGGW